MGCGQMDRNIGVVGLGYVGLPVAVAFGHEHSVVAFDVDRERIDALKHGFDYTKEVSRADLNKANIHFTYDASQLYHCDFIIVAVPTPITFTKQPDLDPLRKASESIGTNLKEGTIIVYESTVYPGATEEVCIPTLEKHSGLKADADFFVGYSPERINPGDHTHTFESITKVVSGQNRRVTEIIAKVYGSVVEAGVFEASSIKVAEAAKVIENTQRDINIALMNELAVVFDKIGVDTQEVLQASNTKWNFLPFNPGLVGGHCIGVDPYYLTYKAEAVGYHPEVILAGRRINDTIAKFIATSLVKQMIHQNVPIQGSVVTILGLTFKENVPDLRNSKVFDLINELKDFGIGVQVTDALVSPEEVLKESSIELISYEKLEPADAVVLAVPHSNYLDKSWEQFKELLKDEKGIFADVRSKLDKKTCPNGIALWRL